jgi:hypothetical protein
LISIIDNRNDSSGKRGGIISKPMTGIKSVMASIITEPASFATIFL